MITFILCLITTLLFTYVYDTNAPVNPTVIVKTQSKPSPAAGQTSPAAADIDQQAKTLVDDTIKATTEDTVKNLFQESIVILNNLAEKATTDLSNTPATVASSVTNFIDLYNTIKNKFERIIDQFERDAQDAIINQVIKLDNLNLAKNFRDLHKESLFESTIINEFAQSLQDYANFLIKKLNEFAGLSMQGPSAKNLLTIPMPLLGNRSLTQAYIDEKQAQLGAPTKVVFNDTKKSGFWSGVKDFTAGFGNEFKSLLIGQARDTAIEFANNAGKKINEQFTETKNQVKEALTEKALRSLGLDPQKKISQQELEKLKKEDPALAEKEEQLEKLSEELAVEAEQEEAREQFELVNKNKKSAVEIYYLGTPKVNLLKSDNDLKKDFLLQGFVPVFPGGRLGLELPQSFKNERGIILVLRANGQYYQYKYYIFNPKKTIFIEVSNENKTVNPAAGIENVTESGLSLKNNVGKDDIEESKLFTDKKKVLDEAINLLLPMQDRLKLNGQ